MPKTIERLETLYVFFSPGNEIIGIIGNLHARKKVGRRSVRSDSSSECRTLPDIPHLPFKGSGVSTPQTNWNHKLRVTQISALKTQDTVYGRWHKRKKTWSSSYSGWSQLPQAPIASLLLIVRKYESSSWPILALSLGWSTSWRLCQRTWPNDLHGKSGKYIIHTEIDRVQFPG